MYTCSYNGYVLCIIKLHNFTAYFCFGVEYSLDLLMVEMNDARI